jgi:hypothetical protein
MVAESKKGLSQIERRKKEMRSKLWPELDEKRLWRRDKGWLVIPRAMPLILQIMDTLSKGKPVSSTFFDLWCRTYDDSFVIGNKEREMALFSGFTGERAVRTWATRMHILEKLGFIDIKEGTNGPISYVLVFNPYIVIRELYESGQVNTSMYNALMQRVIDIGSAELDKPDSKASSQTKGRKRILRRRKTAAEV